MFWGCYKKCWDYYKNPIKMINFGVDMPNLGYYYKYIISILNIHIKNVEFVAAIWTLVPFKALDQILIVTQLILMINQIWGFCTNTIKTAQLLVNGLSNQILLWASNRWVQPYISSIQLTLAIML